MTQKLDQLQASLESTLGDGIATLTRQRGEVGITVAAARYLDVARLLHEHPALKFEQVMDLCGVAIADARHAVEGARYGVVSHLLSLSHNWRVRLKVFAPDDDMPVVGSVCDIWSAANWFEREAFDLYGIIFDGARDLRRILTDYGFIGHPMREDFPTTGHVEMRYDAQTQRVIYQPA